jgi:aspartyl-tRNA(Asn)/glutamyl-tRNA(Gln) amidotransferase subunit A
METSRSGRRSSSAADLAFKPAHEIAEAVRRRDVSPLETAEAALAAIAETDPALFAFSTVAHDQARADAIALEERLARGGACGPLAGVPVAVKDLVLTKGLRTTFGSPLYADYVPDQDDIVVERLRAAGAIVIGKTNAAEFGYGAFGHNPLFPTTRNPWNPNLTPGGSSAGSAAAVAAGVCPLAVGSDGGGSVRLPAAFTGLVGMKASMGRVPVWPSCRDPSLPGVSGWESIEHIGPMTRSVADAALMLSVMAGPDPRDRWSLPAGDVDWRASARPVERLGLKVAYCPQWEDVPVTPAVRALCDRAVATFEALGCVVETLDAPVSGLVPMRRALIALETDIGGTLNFAAGRLDRLSPPLRGLLQRDWRWQDFNEAVIERKRAVEAIMRMMLRYDLMLTPTVPLPAFAIDRDGPGTIDGRPVEDDCWMPAMFPFNLTGQPAISVPAGWTEDGLPVGLQIVGRHLADGTVLRAAAAFEQASPWAERTPPISVSRGSR